MAAGVAVARCKGAQSHSAGCTSARQSRLRAFRDIALAIPLVISVINWQTLNLLECSGDDRDQKVEQQHYRPSTSMSMCIV